MQFSLGAGIFVAMALSYVNAGATPMSWQCQFSIDGTVSDDNWKTARTGSECNPKSAGFITYRAVFPPNISTFGEFLGLYLGEVGDADVVSVAGNAVGKTGDFPPFYKNARKNLRLYYLGAANTLPGKELNITVYSESILGRGVKLAQVQVDQYAKLSRHHFAEETKRSLPLPLITALSLVTFFLSFLLWLIRKNGVAGSITSLMAISATAYTFFLSRYPYDLGIDNLSVYKGIVVSVMLFIALLAAHAGSFSRSKLDLRSSALLFVIGFFAAAVAVFKSNATEVRAFYQQWYIFALIILVYASIRYYFLKRLYPRAKFLFYGIASLFGTSVSDMLRAIGRPILNVDVSHYGLGAFSISIIVSEIYQLFVDQKGRIRENHEIEMRLKMKDELTEAIINNNAQVAHDIRSPLSALNMVAAHLSDVPEEKRLLLKQVSQRINDIANGLVGHTSGSARGSDVSLFEDIMLVAVLDPLVSEKRVQFREKIEIDIQDDFAAGYGIFAKINVGEFSRAISNIVNNSVEAFPGPGKITVGIVGDIKEVRITVSDNAQGISPELLSQLGQRGVTHGKEGTPSGSGLGIYHARKTFESFGGHLMIDSAVGQGTNVTLTIPRSETPKWFVEKIVLPPRATVISVDDDQTVHQIWIRRFQRKSILRPSGVRLQSFSSIDRFKNWCRENPVGADLHLIDYEFLGRDENGLDLIEKLAIPDRSILVTSRYQDTYVRARANELGVRILPKNLAPFVPIEMANKHLSQTDWTETRL